MLRQREGRNKVTLRLFRQPEPSVSSKPDSVTPATVLYWVGLAVLLIVMVVLVWNLFTSPASLGI